MTTERSEGWGFLDNAIKAHYFRSGRALCRKWAALFGVNWAEHQEEMAPMGERCLSCQRSRTRELVKAQNPERTA